MSDCPECGYPRLPRPLNGKCWRANLTAGCRRVVEEAWEEPVKPRLGGRPKIKRKRFYG